MGWTLAASDPAHSLDIPGRGTFAHTSLMLPSNSQSNSAQLLWSPSGCAVLALAASDVDATNQSYYGEQKLYFMASNGQNECAVQLPKV